MKQLTKDELFALLCKYVHQVGEKEGDDFIDLVLDSHTGKFQPAYECGIQYTSEEAVTLIVASEWKLDESPPEFHNIKVVDPGRRIWPVGSFISGHKQMLANNPLKVLEEKLENLSGRSPGTQLEQ